MKKRNFRQPFGYRPGKTLLHRAPAGLKLFFVIVFSIITYISFYGFAFSALFLITASLAARIRPWELLRGSRPIVILSLCVIFFRTCSNDGSEIILPEFYAFGYIFPAAPVSGIDAAGFFEGLMTASRILTSFVAAALLFSVTTMRELRLSLSAAELKLRGKNATIAFFSLGVSLMLGFIPRFFELWETSSLACDARSCRKGIRRLFLIVPLLTERMMEAAADTALALEARALGQGLRKEDE